MSERSVVRHICAVDRERLTWEKSREREGLYTSSIYGNFAPNPNGLGDSNRIKSCTLTEVLIGGSGIGLR